MRPDPGVLARALTVLLLGALAGCSGLTELRGDKPAPAVAPSSEMLQAAQFAGFLASLQQLVQGSPAEQAEVLAAARAGYDQAHQGPAALRYALVLATPGHPGRDPAQAQKLLRECLARPELLTTGERGHAVVELQRVDAELRLTAENTRLVEEMQRERARQNTGSSTAALTRRLQAEQEETARLRKQLDDAKAKLDAIADIERSNADRPAANEGRTP
jgi:hypothetical protein